MIESLRQLTELQKLDERITANEEERARLPSRRSELEESRAAAQAAIELAKQKLEDVELEERRLEGDQSEQEALIEKLGAQTYEVKSQHAYETLRLEIEHAKQAVSDRETRILELMEASDAAQTALGDARAGEREVRSRTASEEETLAKREEQVERELGELRSARVECASVVQAKLLQLYEKIAARRTPALVVVTSDSCPSCRIVISHQRRNEILAASSIVTCRSCDRILLSEHVVAG